MGTNGLVDPYDTADDSFNQWMIGGDSGVMPDEMSPTRYQMYTQSSNPEATRLGYKLLSPGPKDHGIKDVPLFQHDPLFWRCNIHRQLLQPVRCLMRSFISIIII